MDRKEGRKNDWIKNMKSFDAFFQGNIEEILDDDILMINRKKMINNKNVVNKILANS